MKKHTTTTTKQRGFTLIEIMIVVVIIGILSSIILPKILDKPNQARNTKAQSDIKTIEMALQLYKLDKFDYPSSLNALVSDYLSKVPSDPWGNSYGYDSQSGTVHSYGRDRVPGGDDISR